MNSAEVHKRLELKMMIMCVIGSGRMESLYGALLAKNGLQVTLYDPWMILGANTSKPFATMGSTLMASREILRSGLRQQPR